MLNEAWHADVWSGRYGDWAEVMPPRAAPGPLRPSLKLDYRRFSSDALLECFERERDVLRRLTPGIPVTTNFMRPNAGIDHWRFAAAEDIVSCDIYPDPLDPDADMEAAFTHDLMRSLGGGTPWLVMEQAPSAVDWRPVNLPVDPAVVRRRSLQAVAAGADGIMFFQWRGSRSGPELFHSSMLPPGGESSTGWEATVRLGDDLGRLSELAGSRCPPAEVAMLIDWESWWALELEGHPSDELRFRDLALAMYTPLRSASLRVDMCHPEGDLSAYRIALAPNLLLMSEASVRNLTSFVEGGGSLVLGPFSGIVRANYERGDGSHPSLIQGLLGISVEEWWPIPGDDVGCRMEDGTRHRATLWREAIRLDGADAIARFEDPPLDGQPAVTRLAVGDGQAWYLGTVPDALAMKHVLGLALAQAGVSGPAAVPPGVELLRRRSEDTDYVFAINRLDEPVTVDLDARPYVDLLTRHRLAGALSLGPQGVAVLRAEPIRSE
jgi:beta-galactosidase